MDINIYGSIGYTFLSYNNHYILLLADMHSQLKYCKDFKKISLWFKSKFNTSNILLEEVPRNESIQLKGIFEESDHTKELKEFYLNNKDIVIAIDIRPYLLPFSWEVNNDKDIKLSEYLNLIDCFFQFKKEKVSWTALKNKLKSYRLSKSSECDIVKLLSNKKNKINIHFSVIKCIYKKFKDKYRDELNKSLIDIIENNRNILEEVNYHLDNIMEFYAVLKMFSLKNDNKNIIIHTGLVHSEKILNWLTNVYDYNINYSYGVNNIDKINEIDSGCLVLPKNIDNKF